LIFVDSNIPMYLIGAAHPHRTDAQVIVDEVFPIEKAEVSRAGEIAQNRALLSARDAVHIAVMERHSILSILSFDRDFDRWPGIWRIRQI